MDKKQYYTGLILKSLTGDIQPNEQIELDIWLKEHNDHQELFENIKSNWELYPAENKKAAFAYQRLIQRLNLPYQPSQSSPTETSSSVKRISIFPYRVAAAITGLLLLTFLTYYLVNAPSRTI